MLVAEHRRARVVGRAAQVRQTAGSDQENALGRLKSRVRIRAAETAAATEVLASDSLEDQFQALESEDKVELLLSEIKTRLAPK
jgi:phage shock protein A